MKKKPCLLALFFILLANLVFSQANNPPKWGDIPESDLKMTVYADDTSANAVVLSDYGHIFFKYNSDRGFIAYFFHHRRLKVFDKSAFQEGNLLIPFYSADYTEKMKDLDVVVIAPDGTKTKVKTDNIFTEKITKRISAKKVFIPNLQKGSVVEYRYLIETDDWLTLRPWYFQEDNPVRRSEIELNIPEYFEYIHLNNITKPFALNELTEKTEFSGGSSRTITRRMVMEDMPAMKEEPFVTTLDDYRSNVRFQLKRINYPNRSRDILSTWHKLAEDLETLEGFGEQYLKRGRYDKIWKAFQRQITPGMDTKDLAELARTFVSNNIKWNGNYRVFVNNGSLNDAFERKTGSSAEINLALLALLREAGLYAWPMLVSTRSNGFCYQEYPFVEQFNTVVVWLQDDTGGLLLDATNPFYPLNFVNDEVYNFAGWVARKGTPAWQPLSPPEYSMTEMAKMTLREDGTLDGQVTIKAGGHSAVYFREKIAADAQGAFLKERYDDKFPETTIDSTQVEGLEAVQQPVVLKFRATYPNAGQVVNDFIYLSPIADFYIDENPFKALTRLYPVNFPYPIKVQYVALVKIPPGYKLEDAPPPTNLKFPNDGGSVMHSVSTPEEGVIQVNMRLTIKQLDFMPDEYEGLRQFFDRIAQKLDEQIVLKKI